MNKQQMTKLWFLTLSLAMMLGAGGTALAAFDLGDPTVTNGLYLYNSMESITQYIPASYWQDVSGSGHSALQNTVSYNGSTDPGGANRATAINFDPAVVTTQTLRENSFLNGHVPDLDPGTSDYSVSLWYYQKESDGNAIGDTRYLLSKGNNYDGAGAGVTPGFSFYAQDGNPGFRMNDIGGDAATVVTVRNDTLGDISATGWHHLVGVVDRTGAHSAANTVSLYVDGALQATNTLPDVLGNPYNIYSANLRESGTSGITTSRKLWMAGTQAGNTSSTTALSPENLEGYMDDVAIYRGALSPANVATLYSAAALNNSTISSPDITPLAIHNFETNLNSAAVNGVMPNDYTANGAFPGTINTTTMLQGSDPDPARDGVLDVAGAYGIDAVWYGDNLDPRKSSYTVGVWFKANSTGAYQYLAAKGNRATNREGWSITMHPTSGLVVRVNDLESDVNTTKALAHALPTTDEWHSVVMVIDRGNGLLKAYFDGQGSGAAGTDNGWSWSATGAGNVIAAAADYNSAYQLALANGGASAAYYPFDGKMDDYAIWMRALTDAEIADLYAVVPEPGVCAMLLATAAALSVVRRRK